MMQPTKSMPLMCHADVATRRQCRSQRKEVLHREAYTQRMWLWPLTPSQAVRRKRRWNLANSNKLTVFSLSTVGGNRQHMFLYSASIWCQALVVPSIRENTCVCEWVCVSHRGVPQSPDNQLMGLLCNTWEVSVAISKVKYGTASRDRRKLDLCSQSGGWL